MTKFSDKPLEKRQKEYKKISESYPDRIPVIVENSKNSLLEDLDKKKFLVPNTLTVGNFIFIIRKRIKLSPEMGIYLFIDNDVPSTGQTMGALHALHKSQDGFLYVTYSGESTFGSK